MAESDPTRTPDPDPAGMLRPVLWLVLILSAAANATASAAGANPFASVGFGLITLACAATLVVHHYRRRARG
jgi:hypothetical protein